MLHDADGLQVEGLDIDHSVRSERTEDSLNNSDAELELQYGEFRTYYFVKVGNHLLL